MKHLILYRPQMPGNVGAILRTSVCFNMRVHIIGPLVFPMSSRSIKRSGMDYLDKSDWILHPSLDHFMLSDQKPKGWFVACAKAKQSFRGLTIQDGWGFMFGSESQGVPSFVKRDGEVSIPMHSNVRSMNLASSVAVLAAYSYEM